MLLQNRDQCNYMSKVSPLSHEIFIKKPRIKIYPRLFFNL
ncbi:hypothetical protein LM600983_110168 [Listeria monocytogenes]|nr:hypothetical protein LM600983_110168 [Listeria monocytogenes]